MSKKLIKTLLFATSSALSFAAFSAQIYWKSSVTEGYINATGDNSGWTGGVVPVNGDAGEFNSSLSANTTYTVKIPQVEGGYSYSASTYGNGLPQGTKVVFDATGTKWTVEDANSNLNNIMNFKSNNHIFKFEGELGNYGFSLSDGVLSYAHDNEGYVVTLESGTFDSAFHADGTTATSHSLKLLYAQNNANDRVVFKDGTVTKLRNVELRGHSENGEFLIEGGEHHIYGQLRLGSESESGFPISPMRITNGTVTVETDTDIKIGDAANTTRLILEKSGKFVHNGNKTVFCPNNSASTGIITLKDNATWEHKAGYGLALGHNGGTGIISMGDNSVFASPGGINVGDGNNGTGRILIEDEAEMSVSTITLSHAAGTTSELTMRGGTLKLAPNASITSGNGSPFKGGAGTVKCLFDGGTIIPGGNDSQTVQSVPAVELGVNGVTVDTGSNGNVKWSAKTLNAKDADDNDVAGLFVKDGSGVLIVRMSETDGNAQGIYAGRSLNSEHANTLVKAGTLRFDNQNATDGYCRFGKSVSVTDGAVLSLKGSGVTKLVVDNLTLGNGNGATFSTIAMDSGDVVEIGSSLAANAGAIDASWINGDGEYTIFTCANGVTVDQSALDNIVLLNPPSGKDYIWVTSVDEVTGVTSCKIKVGDEGTLGPHSSIVYTDGVGVVDPDGSTDPVGSISGYGSAQDDLNLHRVASATVAENNTLTLGGALTGDGRTTLTKTGSGKLAITGDNSETYNGGFAVDGGILSIEDKAALGPVGLLTKNLALKSGTLAFENGDTSDIDPITLTIATGENKKPAIVQVANGATLTAQNVVHLSGALVKTGAGELALDLGAGEYTVVKNNGNENNDNSITLPASGDSPTETATLSALTVLEGSLHIMGSSADNTTVKANDPVLIGGNYAGNSAPSLVLEDVTFSTEGKHISFGRKVPSGGKASELHMTNAVMRTNKLEVGHDGSTDNLEFIVDLKNSTIVDNWKIQFCWGNAAARITADNSVIECTGDNGVIIGRINSAVFTGDNAALRATKADGTDKAGRLLVYNSNFSEGSEVRFADGARLVTTRGVRYENSDNSKGFLATVFDGGIFEVNASTAEQNCRSRMAQSERQGFTVEDGGLEVAIADGVNHYITFPIRGTGDIVKTGAGTLYLTESYDLDTASTEKLLQVSGTTVVSNGTLVVDGSLVDGAKSFEVAEGATLDLNETTLASATISGAGVVTNGTLSAATIAYDADAALTFEDVAFNGALTVDFGCTAENPLDRDAGRAGITVAHYTGEAAPVIAKVVPANTGIVRAKAKVECNEGDIVVTVVQSGLQVYIR